MCVYQDWGTVTENDPYEGVCLSGLGHCDRMTHMRVCVYQDLGAVTENDPYEGVCLSGLGHCDRMTHMTVCLSGFGRCHRK